MNVPFVDLKRQYYSIKGEIDAAIKDVLDNSAFILGKNVEEFEKEFAKFCGVKHVVGVSSGTEALHLALIASGIGPGNEVITVPNSFFATAEAITHAGAKPVFVDVGETFNMDAGDIEKKISPKTRAIMPAHLYGQPCDMGAITEIAERHSLKIITDCCQAHGAEYNGSRQKAIGEIGCFSFYPAKNLGAFGEGGAIALNDDETADKIRILRAHGEKPKNTHSVVGYNYRMEGLQGAVLKTKLRHLDKWIEKRRKNAEHYRKLLKNAPIELPTEEKFAGHVYHLFVVKTPKRDLLMKHLNDNGIATGIHYPVPIHLQTGYAFLNYGNGSFPVAEKNANQILSLPMFEGLTKEEIEFVAEKIQGFFR